MSKWLYGYDTIWLYGYGPHMASWVDGRWLYGYNATLLGLGVKEAKGVKRVKVWSRGFEGQKGLRGKGVGGCKSEGGTIISRYVKR